MSSYAATASILMLNDTMEPSLDDELPSVSVVVAPASADYDDYGAADSAAAASAADTNLTRREMIELGVQDLLDQWRYQVSGGKRSQRYTHDTLYLGNRRRSTQSNSLHRG